MSVSLSEHPLSPSQLQLWKSQVISPGSPLFNQVSTATLPAALFTDADAQAMCQAWENLQRLHPVFSARIVDDGSGNPRQQFSGASIPMALCNIISGSADENICVQEWVQARSQFDFTLNEGLVDAALLRVSPAHVVVYLNMHHLIADALSTTIIWQTLFDEYTRLQEQRNTSECATRTEDQRIATNTFIEYLQAISDRTPKAPLKELTPPTIAVAQIPLPCFHGQLPGRPTSRSTRLPVELSDSERSQLQLLPELPAYRLINRNLGEMCIHLSALAVFLHKVSDDTTIVMDAPISGRFEKRWTNSVGNFMEMIRLRVTLNDDDAILDVHAKTRTALFAALGAAAPGCTANLQAEPVHGVLNFIKSDAVGTAKTPANIRWHHTGHSDTHHPCRLHVTDWNSSGTPLLDIDLNHGCFTGISRTRAPGRLAGAYRAIIRNQAITLRELSIQTRDEQWHFTGPATSTRSASFATVPQSVAQIASRYPTSTAVADEHESLSYQTLLKQSHLVSQNLQQQGFGRGDRVAVFMSCGLNLPIIVLGILQTGAAYIPIDRSQPMQRLLDILADASASCVICDVGSVMPESTSQSVLVASDLLTSPTSDSGTDSTCATVARNLAPAAEDPAYIIFTSGSTGIPKGVVVSHGALMNYLTWAEQYYRLCSPISMPLFTSIAFDLTVTSLFLPWLTGGRVQVFSQSGDDPVTLLSSVFCNEDINTVKLTPAHLALLAHSDTTSPSIEQLIVGGEDLKCATAEQTRSCFAQQIRIVNEYGPTEATVGSVVKDWTSTSRAGSVPIGLPIAGTSAYVLNEQGQPQLEGMVGELFLGGDSLASGYLNDDAKTAERFVPNPWQPGRRLYRTGDLVRVTQGELVYLGRKDAQINVNGFRVELAEVEAVIASHPGIRECVVLGGKNLHQDIAARHLESNTIDAESFCKRCGLSSRHPDADLDSEVLCRLCRQYASNQSRIDEYFKTREELTQLVARIKARKRGQYDAVVLLSGGKDSTFALSKLVDLGMTVYAFTLDNGYISDQAKNNVDAVCQSLGIDHHYATTAHMKDIFADSLTRYSNVCHGCFKTIYNLSMAFAAEHDIDYVFTGLSRGQLFETRLNNELFSDTRIPVNRIDAMTQAARIQYHAIKDAPNTLLNIREVNDGSLPSTVTMVDFYRYWHVEMTDMLDYLKTRVGWVRPKDTGRSTNCLINDVGIHVHKLERGFHNYSLPYSWDVRLGHKTRTDALDELNDVIDLEQVETILDEIGYVPDHESVTGNGHHDNAIQAFYTTTIDLTPNDMTAWLNERLPSYMLPQRLVRVASMPLSTSGKIDRQAVEHLPPILTSESRQIHSLTEQQQSIAQKWKNHLTVPSIGPNDNFFQIGGDSLAAIRCVMDLRRDGYPIEPADLFRHPTLADFCRLLEGKPRQDTDSITINAAPEQFASLKPAQSEKLKKLLQRE